MEKHIIMYKEKIAQDIKARRKVLNIDQKTLANLAGVHKNSLIQLESGSGNPTLEVLIKICEVLGLELKTSTKNFYSE